MISYHMTKRLSHDDVPKYHMILRMGSGRRSNVQARERSDRDQIFMNNVFETA